MSDILILGYYGFKNSGDDALLLSIIEQLRKQKNDIKINVLSQNPEETTRIYNVKSVKRNNIFSLLSSIISCKMLMLGGGTLIQDSTSTKSLLYYLAVIRIAQFFGKKVMLYSNGIGPVCDRNRKITRTVLNRVDVITLRDTNSFDELKKIGVDKPKIEMCADCAFCIDVNKDFDIEKHFEIVGIPADKKYFCVSLRDHKKLNKDFIKNVSKVCDYVSEEYNLTPVFIPFQKERDIQITKAVMESMECKSYIYDTQRNLSDLLGVILNAELCVGMRLHSLIYSALCNTPLVGLVYDPKITGFMEYIGQKNYIDAETLLYDELKQRVDYCFENSLKIKEELKINSEKMRLLAQKSAKTAIELLLK